MDSTLQTLDKSSTPEQHSLGALIDLVKIQYPDENTDDINTLRRLLVIGFGGVFSHEDIVEHYVVSLEEEDAKLQYKHLNIKV